MTRKNRNAAAGVLAFALSLAIAPTALAEPYEGEQPGPSTAIVELAPGWEQNKGYIEYLERQEPAAQSSTADSSEPQMPKAQVEYLERQAGAAEATDDSGLGWLLGAGVIIVVAIGSVIVAVIRSRRPETAEPAEREREKLTV